jgi:hypothetical protein
MINFNNLPKRSFPKGKFIRPGTNIILTIKDIIFETSQNHNYKKVAFFMETEPITDENWEGWEGAEGQIGKIGVNGGYYMKKQEDEFSYISNLKDIASKVGVLDDCNDIEAETIEEFTEKIKPYLIGTKAKYFVRGSEYTKQNGNGIGLKLSFPKFNFVESLDIPDTESKLELFDETNQWHYSKLPTTTYNSTSDSSKKEDLPF